MSPSMPHRNRPFQGQLHKAVKRLALTRKPLTLTNTRPIPISSTANTKANLGNASKAARAAANLWRRRNEHIATGSPRASKGSTRSHHRHPRRALNPVLKSLLLRRQRTQEMNARSVEEKAKRESLSLSHRNRVKIATLHKSFLKNS